MSNHPHTKALGRKLLVSAIQFVMIAAAVLLAITLYRGEWPL